MSIQLSSDLIDNPSSMSALDAKRRGYIDVTMDCTYLTMVGSTNRGLLSAPNLSSFQWETQSQLKETPTEQYKETLQKHYTIRYVLQAGNAGVWSVTTDAAKTHLPQLGADGNLAVQSGDANVAS